MRTNIMIALTLLLTGHAIAATNCNCCDGKYCDTYVKIGSNAEFFHLSWTITGDWINFGLVMQSRAWMGLGLSASGDMSGAYAVIGTAESAEFKSGVYVLEDTDLKGVLKGKQPMTAISNFTFEQNSLLGDQTSMSFSRLLTIPGATNKNANVDLGKGVGFILAGGLKQSITEKNPHKHQNAAITIDLRNGGHASVLVNQLQLWTVAFHAAFMMLAWVALIPLGILMSKIRGIVGGKWFQLHKWLQIVGFVLAVIGFFTIVIAKFVSKSQHFYGPHGRMGLAVMVLAIGQPIGGAARPPGPKDGEHKSFKRALFEIFHIGFGYITTALAIFNVFIGLKFLPFPQDNFPEAAEALSVIMLVIVSLMLLMGLVGAIIAAKKNIVPTLDERKSLTGEGPKTDD